jgi:hypothetical protein
MCFIGFSFRRAGRRGRYSRGAVAPYNYYSTIRSGCQIVAGGNLRQNTYFPAFSSVGGGASNRPMTAILRGLCKVVYSYTDLKIFGFFILILL